MSEREKTADRSVERSSLGQRFCKLVLSICGWRIHGKPPAARQYIVVVGPHTSNWDFVLGMVILIATGVRYRFLIKQSVFKFGFGKILRALGAIPVNRRLPKQAFASAVAVFDDPNEHSVLVITPEGTRSGKDRLKNGFHTIAQKTGKQVMPVSLDYQNKVAKLTELHPVADKSFEEVSAWLDAFYAGVKGKNGYWMDRAPNA